MGIDLEFERPLAPLREQLEGLDKEVAAGATDELRLRRTPWPPSWSASRASCTPS